MRIQAVVIVAFLLGGVTLIPVEVLLGQVGRANTAEVFLERTAAFRSRLPETQNLTRRAAPRRSTVQIRPRYSPTPSLVGWLDAKGGAALGSSASLTRVRSMFRAGDHLAAAQLAVRLDPQMFRDPRVQELLSLALVSAGAYHDAAEAAHAVEYYGDIQRLAGYYASASDHLEQIRLLESRAAQQPDSADLAFLLGFFYKAMGRSGEAATAFRIAHRERPTDMIAKKLARE